MPVLKKEELKKQDAIEYLSLYLGESEDECSLALNKLWRRLSSKLDSEYATKRMREIIAYTILYQQYNKSRLPDKPINLLFYCQKYDDLEEREWWPLLQELMQQDAKIKQIREYADTLGVIHPLEYSPTTRQALNWLQGQFNKGNDPALKKQIKMLVYSYGGKAICETFNVDREAFEMRNIPSWNSIYFFERLMFKLLGAKKIVKLKMLELEKTSPTLIVKPQK